MLSIVHIIRVQFRQLLLNVEEILELRFHHVTTNRAILDSDNETYRYVSDEEKGYLHSPKEPAPLPNYELIRKEK